MNAAGIDDQNGNPGSGTLSTSWLMDTTPPTSTVNPLPQRGTSLTFAVSVTGSDGGSPPSGVKSYDIYSIDQRRSLDALDDRPGLQPNGQLHRPEQHDLCLLQHGDTTTPATPRSTIRRSRPARICPDLTPPVTSVDGTTGHQSEHGEYRHRHVHAQPDREVIPAAVS